MGQAEGLEQTIALEPSEKSYRMKLSLHLGIVIGPSPKELCRRMSMAAPRAAFSEKLRSLWSQTQLRLLPNLSAPQPLDFPFTSQTARRQMTKMMANEVQQTHACVFPMAQVTVLRELMCVSD